jgi:type III secretion protein V
MTMSDMLTRVLAFISRRSDLVVGILVLVAVVMMIIPLPTALVDVLITSNIAASVLILLTALYITRPIEFSSLPSVILVATLFRLAITITTARLVLLQADAGEIVNAFGSFVIGSNIAVGLVMFLIITVAQFVVITKGSERVAEVAARFSLDALPGKQMSIDSDLRNGDINQAEARRLRRSLERESHLYGAMDGAAKFVKGDAIASLIVVLVNLLGGLAVGTLQHGMSLMAATQIYSRLTVGDGLVAQIPALLVSVAAGTVVTRVGSDERTDLGTDIVSQLVNNARALGLAAAVMLGLAFIPGFPPSGFLLLAALFVAAAYWVFRHKRSQESGVGTELNGPATEPKKLESAGKPPDTAKLAGAEPEKLRPTARVIAWVGRELAGAVPVALFETCAEQVRQQLRVDLGVVVPPVQLCVDETSEPQRYHIDLEGVPVAEGEIPADCLLVEGDAVHLEILAIPYRDASNILGQRPAVWVDSGRREALSESKLVYLTPLDVLAKCLAQTLRRNVTHFVGIQETRALLAGMEPEYGELVKEAQGVAPLHKIAEILRRLAEENVPIGNLRLILEALIEWGQREQDVVLLAEYIRMGLRRQICFRCADRNRVMAAYVLARSAEDAVRAAVRPTAVGSFLSISEEAIRPVIDGLREMISNHALDAGPIVLTSMDVRRHIRTLLMRNDIDLPVLSYQEVAPEFSVQPLATIGGELAADIGDAEIEDTPLALESAAQ